MISRLRRCLKWVVWKLASPSFIILQFVFSAMQLEDWKCRNKRSCCTCVIAGAVSVLLQASLLLRLWTPINKCNFRLKAKIFLCFFSLNVNMTIVNRNVVDRRPLAVLIAWIISRGIEAGGRSINSYVWEKKLGKCRSLWLFIQTPSQLLLE